MTVNAAEGRNALANLVAGKDGLIALEPMGRDLAAADGDAEIAARIAANATTLFRFPYATNRFWDLSWPSISLSSIPAFLMVVAQKKY